MSTPDEVARLSYEEALEQLEALVAALEEGRATLAEAVERYERGMLLAAHCSRLLDTAELRVRELGAPTPTESSSADGARDRAGG